MKYLDENGLAYLWSQIEAQSGGGSSIEEIYVGSTAPASGNYKVWIDSQGTVSKILTSGQVEDLIDSKLEEVENGYY